MNRAPGISLPRFEGPLDLLLELVRKNEVEITNIPIAEITRQYLDYMDRAQHEDLNLGSEFAYMAATLIQIKSRRLLPSDPEIAKREPDPAQELIRQLLDRDQVREGAEFLQKKLEFNEVAWSRPSRDDLMDRSNQDIPAGRGTMNLAEVLRLARRALDTARMYNVVVPVESVSVEEMIDWLKRRIAFDRPVPAEPLFIEAEGRSRKAVLFLAMLELCKRAQIRLEQHSPFGPVTMERLG